MIKDFSDRLIVTDLDGTFFGPKASLVQRNLDAIERFKARGGFFTISTGRMHTILKKPIPMVETLVNAPVGCCNGGLIFDIRTKEVVGENVVRHEEARELIHYTHEKYPELAIRLAVPKGFMVDKSQVETHAILQKEVKIWPEDGFIYYPYEKWEDHPWYKIVVRGESDTLDRLRAELEPMNTAGLSFSKSGETFFEIQGRGVTKASVLPVLSSYCENISGKKPKIYACGDYENDLEMIRQADVGVCPCNGQDLVRNEADLVLCENGEGLIADLIEKMERGEV